MASKEGNLEKRGGPPLRQWKRRHFLVRDKQICYFKDAKKATEPKMKLVITGCQIVTYPQDAIGRAGAAFGVVPAPGMGGRSAIRGGKRKVYVFNAPNDTERDLWIGALVDQGATRYQRPEGEDQKREEGIKEGYLIKVEKGITGKKRTKLFFSLSHQGLAISQLEMEQATDLIQFTPDTITATDTTDMHAFSIKGSKGNYVLVCADDHDRDAWVRAVTTAHLARFPAARGSAELASPVAQPHPLAVLMGAPSKESKIEVQRRATTGGVTPTGGALAASPTTPSSSSSSSSTNSTATNVNNTPPRRGSQPNGGTSGTTPAFFTAHLLPSASEVTLLTTIDPATGQPVAGTYVLSHEDVASQAQVSSNVSPAATTTPSPSSPATVLPSQTPTPTPSVTAFALLGVTEASSTTTSATSTCTNTPAGGTPRSSRPSFIKATSMDTDGALIEFSFTAANSPTGSTTSSTSSVSFAAALANRSSSNSMTHTAPSVTVSGDANTSAASQVVAVATVTTTVTATATATDASVVTASASTSSISTLDAKRPSSIITDALSATNRRVSSSTPSHGASSPPTPQHMLPALNTSDVSPMLQPTGSPSSSSSLTNRPMLMTDLASPSSSLSFGPPRVEDEPDSPVSPSQPYSFSLQSPDTEAPPETPLSSNGDGSSDSDRARHSRKKSHGFVLREQREKEQRRAKDLTDALAKMLRDVAGGDTKLFNRVLQSFMEENASGSGALSSLTPVTPGGSPLLPPKLTDAEPDELPSGASAAGATSTTAPRVLKLRESNRRPGTPMSGTGTGTEITPSTSNESLASPAITPMHHPRTTSMLVTSSERKHDDDINGRSGRAPSVVIGATSTSGGAGDKPGLQRALSSTPMAKDKSAMSKMKGLFGAKKKKKMVVELEEDEHMTLDVHLLEAVDLTSMDPNGYSDPFCKVYFKNYDTGLETKSKDSQIKNVTLNPIWDEVISVPFSGDWSDTLHVDVYDFDKYSTDDFIGRVAIPMSLLESSHQLSGWYHLMENDSTDNKQGSVHLRLELAHRLPPPPSGGIAPSVPTSVAAAAHAAAAAAAAGGGGSAMTIETKSSVNDDAITQKIKVFIGTWNVGNKPPPDDLTPWIPDGYDIYCIGTQECKYNPRGDFASCAGDWGGSLIRHFGRDFTSIKYNSLWEIRMAVFARNEHMRYISNVQSHTEACGVGNVLGNKGGVVTSFTFNHTSLCFINSHLAAHQHHVAARNADVARIIANTKVGPAATHSDVINSFHHVFWMGDLNYRLAYGDAPEAKSPSQAVFDEMTALVESEKYDQLFRVDQLLREREAGRVFMGWAEGKYHFRPTFKVERRHGVHYNPQRSPAWCDRVLWKSIAGFPCRQLTLGSVESISTSDHKPVVSCFEIDTFLYPAALDKDRGTCTMSFQFLRCTDLKVYTEGVVKRDGKKQLLFDSFLEISAPFLPATITSSLVKKSVSPGWDDIPSVALKYNNHSRIQKSLLLFRVVNVVNSLQSATLGRCLIPLTIGDKLKPHIAFEFNCQLTHGGLPVGSLEGTVRLDWTK